MRKKRKVLCSVYERKSIQKAPEGKNREESEDCKEIRNGGWNT